MTYLPSSPEIGGPKLVAYLNANQNRRAVFDNIQSRLATMGRVDDLARYYIVRSEYRREVFRGILAACRCRIPGWAKECRTASELNRKFIVDYREAYNAYRRDSRIVNKGATDEG